MAGTFDLIDFRNFAIALLIGALVGIEREKKKDLHGDSGTRGIRSFILLSQAGAISAWLSQQLHTPWIFAATILAVSTTVIAGYVAHTHRDADSLGLTTELAAIIVCLLGGAAVLGFAPLAVALAIATSATLAFKQPLHSLVQKLGTEDIYAGLKLLVATFIVLPVLPNRALDPWGALNPYKLWWLVILISTLSLIGYVATRWLGPERGIALAGFTGGLVSSTAVTLSFARQSRVTLGVVNPGGALVVGILLAWTIMFFRVIVLVAVVNVELLSQVAVPFGVMGVVNAVVAVLMFRGDQRRPQIPSQPVREVPLQNPFSLTAAIKFAAFFAIVLLVVKLAERYLTGQGLYVIAGVAGLVDVDAISLSMADFARQGGVARTAVIAITIAALANTVAKAGIVALLGSVTLRPRTFLATGLILVSGLLALVFI